MTQEPETPTTAAKDDADRAVEVEVLADSKVVDADTDASADAKPKPKPAAAPQVATAVVGTGATDDVLLSRCIYKSRVTRKSLSVHHLQRRLFELGFPDAGSDKDGWYGDLTLKAVKEFQAASKLEATGVVDAVTLQAIFKGDPNVTVVIDA